MKKVLILSSLLLASCLEEKDYCAEYVDYMCSCHEDDPNYDCAAQQAIYEETTFDQQNQCATTLDEQLVEDENNGVNCQTGDTGSPS